MITDPVEKDMEHSEELGTQDFLDKEGKLQTPLLVTACVDHKDLSAQ